MPETVTETEIDKSRIAQQLVDNVKARHHPTGHPHPEEYEAAYLSGSRIVKQRCGNIAYRLSEQKAGRWEEDDDPSDGWYSFRGDTLHEGSLPQDEGWYHDVEAGFQAGHKQLDDGEAVPAHLIIHPDGVKVVDGTVCVAEHKAFDTATHEKIDAAIRQATLGLASMWWVAHRFFEHGEKLDELAVEYGVGEEGDGYEAAVHFYPVDYDEDDGITPDYDKEPFIWKRSYDVGVVLWSILEDPQYDEMASGKEPSVVGAKSFDEDELRAIVDHYGRKSAAVWSSVNGDDLKPAIRFEDEHATALNTTHTDGVYEDVSGDIGDLAKAKHHAKEMEKLWKGKKKRANRRLKEALREVLDDPEGDDQVEGDWGEAFLQRGANGRRMSVTTIDDVHKDLKAIEENADELSDEDLREALQAVREELDEGMSPKRTYYYAKVNLDGGEEED